MRANGLGAAIEDSSHPSRASPATPRSQRTTSVRLAEPYVGAQLAANRFDQRSFERVDVTAGLPIAIDMASHAQLTVECAELVDGKTVVQDILCGPPHSQATVLPEQCLHTFDNLRS